MFHITTFTRLEAPCDQKELNRVKTKICAQAEQLTSHKELIK